MNWKALFHAVLFVLGYAALGISAVSLLVWLFSKLGGFVVSGGFLAIFLLLLIAVRYQEQRIADDH